MTEPHKISEIQITMAERRFLKSNKMWFREVPKPIIEKLVKLINKILPVETIEINDSKGKKYKSAKAWRIRAIIIHLKEPVMVTFTEEYEQIYRPINSYLMTVGHYLYNMWGYNDFHEAGGLGHWQMDGRHTGLDK